MAIASALVMVPAAMLCEGMTLLVVGHRMSLAREFSEPHDPYARRPHPQDSFDAKPFDAPQTAEQQQASGGSGPAFSAPAKAQSDS